MKETRAETVADQNISIHQYAPIWAAIKNGFKCTVDFI